MNITKDRTQEIKKELSDLNDCLKMSVSKAVRIGELLTEQKEFVGHGNFLSWLESNFDMGERTARKYMLLYCHRDKTALNADLQKAYDQIETIEKQEKQKQEQEDNKKIFQYKKTGIKPEGWERRHDSQYKKMLDDGEYEKRRDSVFEQKKAKSAEKENEFNFNQSRLKDSIKDDENLINRLLQMKTESQKSVVDILEHKEKLKLCVKSEDNIQTAIFLLLDEYIDKIKDGSRKIETAQNIIKYLRDKIVKIQKIS
jgi:hypothetical protein